MKHKTIKILKLVKTVKNPVKRIKRQTEDWEKIFADHIPKKEMESRIYYKCLKFNSKKIK